MTWSCGVHRLVADQVTVDADDVDSEQDDVLGADPLRLVGDEAPSDERDRRGDEDHERPAGRPPAEIERDDQRGDRAGDRAVPFEAVDQALAHPIDPVIANGCLTAGALDGKRLAPGQNAPIVPRRSLPRPPRGFSMNRNLVLALLLATAACSPGGGGSG